MPVEYRSSISVILRELPNALDAGLEETANDILTVAQELVPIRTGFLHDSGRVVKRADAAYEVEFTAPYAAAVEFGSSNGNPAQPYLTPAIRNLRNPSERVRERIRRILP